jgi:hypothetical protein
MVSCSFIFSASTLASSLPIFLKISFFKVNYYRDLTASLDALLIPAAYSSREFPHHGAC